jgi:methylenetetrahydrofolate dehydrogenase (NADP+) / methenyltetrahydrofolate cyclohydrolase
MKTLSGTQLRDRILSELQTEVDRLRTDDVQPCLAVILVGDDPASAIYVRNKKQACETIGIRSQEIRLPAATSQSELVAVVQELNADAAVNGILCQVPLPPQCDEQQIIATIDPGKDVDCFHPYNLGLLAAGAPKFMPCTPFGILQLLQRNDYSLDGQNIVIVGRSNIVGRPLSILMSLKGMDGTVTLCHSRTQNIAEICRRADILVAAIGRPRIITADFVKPGAVVIDVGMNRIDDPTHPRGSVLVGDVDFAAVAQKAAAITPVPGGVGPMTIAMLIYNTINAARFQSGLDRYEL